MIFTVGTTDLRRALLAAQPHICPYDELPGLQRVRVTRDPVNVTVAATDRYTAAWAIVSVLDHIEGGNDGEMAAFDLSPQQVKEILLLFKGKGGDTDGDPDSLLRVEVSDTHVVVTDSSGLFDGKQYRMERYADAPDFPNLAGLFATLVRQTAAGGTARVVTAAEHPKRFAAAGKAYSAPLVIEPTDQRTLLVSCGESFLGLWMPQRPSQDDEIDMRQWRDAWLERLPVEDPLHALTGMSVGSVEDLQRYWDAKADPAADDVGEESPPPQEPPDEEIVPEAPADVVDRALLADAARLVIATQYASAAMLQRKLRLGAGLAGLVMDALYARSIVTGGEPGRVRDVLIAADRAEQIAGAITAGADGTEPTPGNVVDLGERRARDTDKDDE